MADTEIIPVIDLGPYLADASGAIDRTAEELRFALTEIGFYFIVNHGVSSGRIDEVFRQVARFHAQPLEKKLEIKLDKHNVGYLPMRGDTLRTSTVETLTKANLNATFRRYACTGSPCRNSESLVCRHLPTLLQQAKAGPYGSCDGEVAVAYPYRR